MKIVPLDCGIMNFPYSFILPDGGSAKETWLPVSIAAYLIETTDGLILFDTGCDPAGMLGKWPEDYRQIPFEERYLPAQLDAIEVKPEDIRYVIASHLHFDHAGCLHLFKNTPIFVSQVELGATLHAYENGLDMDAHLPSDIENWRRADIAWQPIPSDTIEYQLSPGVTIVNLGPGHSWGILGLMVELSKGGNHFLVSDAIYTGKHLGPTPIVPVVVHDREGYLRTISMIESYASRNDAKIIYGHDAEQFRSLLKKGCIQ